MNRSTIVPITARCDHRRATRATFKRFLARGEIEQAAAALDLLGGDGETRIGRRLRFAEALAERGRLADALIVWKTVADRLLVRGHTRRAVAVCRRVLRWAPSQTGWSLRLARILVTEGRLRMARTVLRRARSTAVGFEAEMVAGLIDRIERRLTTGPLALVA